MNILVYSHVALWAVHHAETVELCLKHLACGDTVYLLSCDGALTSCPANPFHDEGNCKACNRQLKWTISKILNNQVIDIRLPAAGISGKTPDFETFEDLERYVEDDVPFGELVVSQLVGDLQDSFFAMSNYKDRIASLLSSAKDLYHFSVGLITERNIDKAYIWNGRRCSDGPVSYAARNCGIKFEAYISGNRPSHYLRIPAPRVHDLEANKKLLSEMFEESLDCLGEQKIREDADLFYFQTRHGLGDYPGYVNFAKDFAVNSKLPSDRSKPILALYTSSFWEYCGMGDYRSGVYANHYDGLEKILTDHRVTEQWSCHVRWHPNLKTCGPYERARIDSIILRTEKKCCHYRPESDMNSYALLKRSSAVVTFGSTIGIEACYYGKPSILVGRAIYEDLNACYCPETHEEVVQSLRTVPSTKDRQGAIKYGFYMRNRGAHVFEFLVHHGGSTFSCRGYPLKERSFASLVSRMRKRLKGLLGAFLTKFTAAFQGRP